MSVEIRVLDSDHFFYDGVLIDIQHFWMAKRKWGYGHLIALACQTLQDQAERLVKEQAITPDLIRRALYTLNKCEVPTGVMNERLKQ